MKNTKNIMTESITQGDQLSQNVNISIQCPVCKEKGSISFDKTKFPEKKRLSTFSIQKGVICGHHFQAFIDSNFNVRGYQKVDLLMSKPKENEAKPSSNLEKIYQDFWDIIDEDSELFQEFIKEDSRRSLLHLSKFSQYFLS